MQRVYHRISASYAKNTVTTETGEGFPVGLRPEDPPFFLHRHRRGE
ncbi:hypothetical protein SUBVAR_04216 [Subdoligranulum variabile DSM 15176]|uniref:Uncharacterized protein n=1 Tax=Subdoligranulum variabile DSM 15176 TaxID=411471 RepID=D1PIQ1_9FIRM|nr:hypothetical protein SUBVAR_04216 [Subdoligranulum variabile DSM 15176]